MLVKRIFKTGLLLLLILSISISGTALDAISLIAYAEGDDDTKEAPKDQYDLVIPHSNAAIYKCTVNYTDGDTVSVKLGERELLSLSNGVLRLCDAKVYGSYTEGTYNYILSINPTQKMVYAEIILPDGGILRRGRSDVDMTVGTISAYSSLEGAILDTSLTFEEVRENEYEFRTIEPESTAFAKNVYNVTSSFDDASTTRLFAWTAKESFVNGEPMAVRYRVAGSAEWSITDATRIDESTAITTEEYFKAEITNLTADTEYEYSIGLKNSTDETKSWSPVYIFKTASEEIGDFTFVAISDNQGVSWGGSTASNKGYKYTLSAANEAFEEHPNAAFILNLGDMTERGFRTHEWNWYFKCLSDYAYTVPHFSVIGNHETELQADDNNNYFALHFNHPDNGKDAINMDMIGELSSDKSRVMLQNYEETIYSYNYGNAHFIALNSGTYSDDDEMIVKAQREWLIRDLEANRDAKWTIVMMHGVTYHRYGGSYDSRWLNDVFESYGVDLVLQGHSHLVTRTHPMKNGQVVSNSLGDTIPEGIGTVYTTIGGTTYIHDPIGDPNVASCITIATPASDQAVYTAVSVKSNKLTVTIKQINGLIIDEFVITDGTPDPIPEDQEENGQDDIHTKTTPVALIVTVAVIIVLVGTTVTFFIIKKKRSSTENKSESSEIDN